MLNRFRLYSGLVLFVFVSGHLINHSLGLISIDAMIAGTRIFLAPWHTAIGSGLFIGALLIHSGVALITLWRRRTLRMSTWEATRIVLGFTAPFILAGHVLATRVLDSTTAFDPNYTTTLTVLWVIAPKLAVWQAFATLVVWGHACIGLHAWLRIYPFYARFQHSAVALAVLVPALALAGYVAAGNRVRELAQTDGWAQAQFQQAGFETWMNGATLAREDAFQIGLATILTLLIFGRHIRSLLQARRGRPRLYYAPGNRVAELQPDATLLESIRAAGIPHASVCGGQGRCSTCRVRIGRGLDDLAPPSAQELKVLARLTQSPSVRLACQLKPTHDVEIAALVRPDGGPGQAAQRTGYRQGREMNVAFLFVDLRGSTKLSEARLPFDVVFILNLFFAELAEALEETGGHYAQFNGDGLLAIYGLTSGPEQGCVEAIEGAKAMFRRLATLNERLSDELTEELKIGVGIHAGEAIVGSMGPPASPIVSALGDNVNIAARLESQTKEFGVPMVISTVVAERSRTPMDAAQHQSIQVKGRDREVGVYAINHPERLLPGTMIKAL
ncbi:MAG: adenylate/guanylate cyclase domain-containing protein [Rhodospirillales bacterium]|nr:adenylate/guanylate cyclase domain-containing protein [Rhodospirillales bacterium]